MSKKILVADDSLTIQKVIELTFMDEAHEVTAVSDGQEAIDRLNALAPDVVIADVHMPGLSGLDVCRRVKESTPGLPVLLLVGTFEPFEMDEAEEAGADAVLRKPFDSQELMEEVERLLSSTEGEAAGATEEAADEGGEEVAASADATADGGEEAADDAHDDTAPTGVAAEPEVFAMPEAGDQPSPSNWGFEQEAEPFRLGETASVEDQAEEPAPIADPWQELEVAPNTQQDSPSASEGDAAAAEPEVAVAAETEPEPDEAPEADDAPEPDLEPEPDAAPAVSERAAMAWKPQVVEATEEPDEEESGTESAAVAAGGALSDDDVERIAQRVAEIVGDRVAKDVAWEVIPDLAEVIIKDRLRELEGQVD